MHIQCVMPGHVECQCLNRGCIAQIVQLLQEKNADDDVKIFRWASNTRVEIGKQFINRKVFKKMVSENLSPRAFQEPTPFLAQFRPAIKQISRPSVT